jgi:hypothetical protein
MNTRFILVSLAMAFGCGDDDGPAVDAGGGRDSAVRDAGSSDSGADAGSRDAGEDDAGSDAGGAATDAGVPGAAAFGRECTDDTDCEGGVCIDFAELDDGCAGRVCTVTCPEEDGRDHCEMALGEELALDCDPGPPRVGAQVCLLFSWEDTFCP